MTDFTRDQWLTLSDAGKILGIDPRTLERLIEVNNIPVIQLERGVRVTLNDLDRLKKPINGSSLAASFSLSSLPLQPESLDEDSSEEAGQKAGKVISVVGEDIVSRTTAALLTGKVLHDHTRARICVIDLDFRNGAVGFMTGNSKPTIINLRVNGLSPKTLEETACSVAKLGIDVILAPKRPRNAEDLALDFVEALIEEAQQAYDYVILCAPAYTSSELERPALQMADSLLYIAEPVISSVFSMTRWIQEVTKPSEQGGLGLNPDKVGVVISNASEGLNMSSDKIERSSLGCPIVSAIPTRPHEVYGAVNRLYVEQLLEDVQVLKAYERIVDSITP